MYLGITWAYAFACALISLYLPATVHGNKKDFVAIVPSYNNARWVEKNLASLLNQDYEGNFRIIYIDDASTDATLDRAEKFINQHPRGSLVTIWRNTERQFSLKNIYDAYHSCQNHEVGFVVDGDDWLAHERVLMRLNLIYQNQSVWLTYGQYRNHSTSAIGCCNAFPPTVLNNNSFRTYWWISSHLRTCYAWLFKMIKKEDLMLDGKFFTITGDQAYMFPLLEMAGIHAKFIPEVLYIYNDRNPINDDKRNLTYQKECERTIRTRTPYHPLTRSI